MTHRKPAQGHPDRASEAPPAMVEPIVREIEFVESLPMTTTGKIRRIELREREIARKRGG